MALKSEPYSEKQTEKRFTAALKRALSTPHKPHKPLKKVKTAVAKKSKTPK